LLESIDSGVKSQTRMNLFPYKALGLHRQRRTNETQKSAFDQGTG
jgi:hypothetical protein